MNAEPQKEKPETPANEDVVHLLERAKKGDATVLPELRRLLDESPALWRGYGDLALQAQASLVKWAGGNNLLLSESLMRKMAELKKDLIGVSPAPLERLLAGRIVACWLQVSHYDIQVSQTLKRTPLQLKTLKDLQDAAHRRYLSAIQALAKVRKLLTPMLSPVEIATRLGGERPSVRLREMPVTAGLPVVN